MYFGVREYGEWFCFIGGNSFIFWMQYSCEDKGKGECMRN